MPALGHERWRLLSPRLDEALKMSNAERCVWLEALRHQDEDLADDLEMLLAQQRLLADEGFLEGRSALTPSNRFFAGQTAGLYTLISEIGIGGMGTVWLAERSDSRFDRRVAIKFLNIALSGMGAEHRFKREGSILARLAHPNIAELIDAGVTVDGHSYLVLEYIEGDHF